MITIRLTPEDLSELRFAYSPLLELSLSYCVLINAEWHPAYIHWVEGAQRALHALDLPYLAEIIPAKAYIPDFLTPTPSTTTMTFEDEIARMLETPDDIVHKNILTLIGKLGDSELRQMFLVYPREMLYCLAEDLRLYWRHTLADHWSRLTAVLDGDILYRARQLALEGPAKVLTDLHPKLAYQSLVIQIDKPQLDDDLSLQGEGLQLVPTVFARGKPGWQIVPEWQPMIIYGARGVGNWRPQTPESNQSLELALGAGRARVLQALETPLNTGELAHKLDVTAGAVSQQLDRLHQAGLVEPHRSGKRVFYQLTQRGVHLLRLFDTS